MKLSVTQIHTHDIEVGANGMTIGEIVNHEIRIAIENGLAVTNVSVTVSQEDMIALKLLQSPVQNRSIPIKDEEFACAESVITRPKLKMRRPRGENYSNIWHSYRVSYNNEGSCPSCGKVE